MRKYFASILLVGFAGWTLFGLSAMAMSHNQGSHMNGGCPLSSLPSSVCPDTLAMAVHHASAYQSLVSSFVYTPIAQALMAVLLFVAVVFILRKYLTPILSLFILSRNFGAKLYRPLAITRWLSLLVNSPSFN